jgi:hypothetical protein
VLSLGDTLLCLDNLANQSDKKDQGDIMTSAHLRKVAGVVAIAVGVVFAASTAHADAAPSQTKVTHKVHAVHVAPTSSTVNTTADWWV